MGKRKHLRFNSLVDCSNKTDMYKTGCAVSPVGRGLVELHCSLAVACSNNLCLVLLCGFGQVRRNPAINCYSDEFL